MNRTKPDLNQITALALQCILSITLFNVCHGQAPNFIETDLDGTVHNLYQDYLDQGKAVYIDLSATWCGPCRGLHETGYFNEFHDIHGPNGYQDGYVFLVESDASTSVNQLYWNGAYSYVDHSNYPIIDDADESVYNSYGGSGYPTVCLVCPDRTFYVEDEADLYWSDIVSATYLEDVMYDKCGSSLVSTNALDVSLMEINSLSTYCGEKYYPKVMIRNMGRDLITSIDFDIAVNGNTTSTYSWSGQLNSYEKTEIVMPYINGSGTTMNVEVAITAVNGQMDDLSSNNTKNKEVSLGYYPLASDEVNIALHIDQMGWQCEWEFIDPENNIIGSQYYYPTGDLDDPLPNVEYYTFSNLDPGCYTFSAFDALANGLNDYSLTQWGSGSDTTIYFPTEGFVFSDVDGNHMASIQTFDYYNDFSILIGAESTGGFVTTIDNQDMVFDLCTYPNPATNALYVEAPLVSTFEMKLFSISGQHMAIAPEVMTDNMLKFDLTHLMNGLYILKVNTGTVTKSFPIQVENNP